MKYILNFLIALLCLTSCKKDKIAHSSDYNFSLQKWFEFKASSKNTYRYNAYSYSGGSGIVVYYQETEITVVDGKVINRNYKSRIAGPNGNVVSVYTEYENSLNTHNEGAPAITLDEIYKKARNEWLNVDKNQNEIVFNVGAGGLIASAGYTPKNCQTDCFRGISIKNIEAGIVAIAF